MGGGKINLMANCRKNKPLYGIYIGWIFFRISEAVKINIKGVGV
jgi:hypothetical protein